MGKSRYAVMPSRVFSDPEITMTEMKVLGVICSHTDENSEAWPSQALIAEKTRAARETVNRALRRLEAKKYVTKYARRRKNGQQAVSIYIVHLEPVDLPQDVVRVDDDSHKNECDRSHSPGDPPCDVEITRSAGRVTFEARPCDDSRHTSNELPTIELPTSIPVSNETASGDLFEEKDFSTQSESPRNSDQRPQNADSPPSGDQLLKSVIFTAGVALLAGQGLKEGSARAFLGGLIKGSSAKIVADCVNAACVENPIDARAWLRQAVEKRAVRAGIRKASDASPEARAEAENGRLADLDRRFSKLAKGQSWQPAWGHDPRIADDGYPPELYQKHGIERPGSTSRRRA